MIEQITEADAVAVTVPTSTSGHTETAEDGDTAVPWCSADDASIDIITIVANVTEKKNLIAVQGLYVGSAAISVVGGGTVFV